MPENLQNNPYFQLCLVLVLAGALIYAGVNFMPNTAEMKLKIANLENEKGKLTDIVNEGLKLEKKLPELRATIREKEKQLETLKKIIPTEEEAEDLIRKLERMAAETSITVRNFAPTPKQKQNFYSEWPITIQADGTYHNLGRFFSKISNYARIINVKDVRIREKRSSKAEDAVDTIATYFTAVTYIYQDEE